MTSALHKLLEKTSGRSLSISPEIEQALNGAARHVAKFAKDIHHHEINLLVIGGASLNFQGLRDEFADIDVLIDNVELASFMPSSLFKSRDNTKIELIYENSLSSIDDPKKFGRGIPISTTIIDGNKINISCYPAEYFLFMKMDLGRDKCQKDIAHMLKSIPLKKIKEAFNDLVQYNEKWIMEDIADMMFTDLTMLSLPGAALGDSLKEMREFCSELKIEPAKKRDLVLMCKHLELQNKHRPTRNHREHESGLSL